MFLCCDDRRVLIYCKGIFETLHIFLNSCYELYNKFVLN